MSACLLPLMCAVVAVLVAVHTVSGQAVTSARRMEGQMDRLYLRIFRRKRRHGFLDSRAGTLVMNWSVVAIAIFWA